MNNDQEDNKGFRHQLKLWDKKLDRLGDETLVYIQQRAYLLLERRAEKLNKETINDL